MSGMVTISSALLHVICEVDPFQSVSNVSTLTVMKPLFTGMSQTVWSFEPDNTEFSQSTMSVSSLPIEGPGSGAWRAIEQANSFRLTPQALRATFRSPILTEAARAVSPVDSDHIGSVVRARVVSRSSSPTNLLGEALLVTLPSPSNGPRVGLGTNGRRLRKGADSPTRNGSILPVVRDVGTPTRESPFSSAMRGRSGWVQSWCHEHDHPITPPACPSVRSNERVETRPITSPVLLPGFSSSMKHRYQTSIRLDMLQTRQESSSPKSSQPLSSLGKTLREPQIRAKAALELHKSLRPGPTRQPAQKESPHTTSAFSQSRRPLIPREWNPRRTNIRPTTESPLPTSPVWSRPHWMHQNEQNSSETAPRQCHSRVVQARVALEDYSRRIQERVRREGTAMLARTQARIQSIQRQRERYQTIVRQSTRQLNH